MKWDEIIRQFKDQWVLIEVKRVDDNLNIQEGDVIAHSTNRDEICRRLLEIRPKKFAIEYAGKIPEDLAVVLFNENIQT